jgi:hypothetical protein
MSIAFFQTIAGKQFFDGTVPRIARALERIAAALETDMKIKIVSSADLNSHSLRAEAYIEDNPDKVVSSPRGPGSDSLVPAAGARVSVAGASSGDGEHHVPPLEGGGAVAEDGAGSSEEAAPVIWIFEVSGEDVRTYSAYPTERDALIRAGLYILARFERVDYAVDAGYANTLVPQDILDSLERQEYRQAIELFFEVTGDDIVVREEWVDPSWTREKLLQYIELRRQFLAQGAQTP